MAPFDRRGAEFHVGMKMINGPLPISAKRVFGTRLRYALRKIIAVQNDR
jgi:hypothetical protein